MPTREENETEWKLACFGELEKLKELQVDGKQFHDTDDRGFTPLNWAARNGHITVVTYLIELGCSVETPSFGGMRPLHHSCNKNLEKIIRLLLSSGAEVNCKDENGDTPLHYAASRGVLNIVVALLEAGAKIGIGNGQAVYPIHKAAMFGHLAVVRRLQETDPGCVNALDDVGETALHYAAKCGFIPIIKFLLDSGMSASVKSQAGLTAKEVALNPAVAAAFP
jgi:ankyrin repeat protein